jgi:predicted AlkP superfamily phosphohydrolase/phosphomutase
VVIGLDGASPALVQRWTDSRDLPALRSLIERGSFGPLLSTIPPVSPAAWSTFMTGQNPAGHGVLGFRNLDSRRYECHEPNIISSAEIAGKTFWDFAGSRDARVGVFWVPITYPPWPVNGVLVSGYPTPDSARSFGHPESAVSPLPGLTENSAFFNSAAPADVATELVRLARERGRVAVEMLRREAFDLFVMVIGSIDRAQHDFWRHFDPKSPVHDRLEASRLGSTILDTYRASDRAIANLLEVVSPNATVFIMSDHGGGPAAERTVHLNAWLRRHGFLAVRRRGTIRRATSAAYGWLKGHLAAKETLFRRLSPALRRRLTAFDAAATLDLRSVDWTQTRAYRFPLYPPFEGVAINLAGRQPHGCVAPGDYAPLRDRLLADLRTMSDPRDGKPIVARAFRREDEFAGEHIERLPDILVQWQPGYGGGPGLWDDWLTPVPAEHLRRLSGAHRPEGILIAAGPEVRCGAKIEGATLADLAPTILYAMGLPRPRSMQGRVLTELFRPEHVAAHLVETAEGSLTPAKPSHAGLSPREQAEIAKRLRALGYMD